ncbi:DUF6049 family protein [Demequina sediminicola]|uniref:DUF6049 family protein n=1 Tax=Demequina sediminicola TaxID=1095026 RepID=UPI0007859EA2|nr:DUF6049 family protein [Demequina sediminicola]
MSARVWSAAVLAIAAMTAASAATAAPVAQNAATTPVPPAPTVATEISGLTATLVDFSASSDRASALSAQVRATNGSVNEITGASVVVSTTAQPLGSSAELAAFLEDPSAFSVVEQARDPELVVPDEEEPQTDDAGSEDEGGDAAEEVPVGRTLSPRQSTTFMVTGDDVDLGSAAGVYGMTVAVVSDQGTSQVDAVAFTWTEGDIPALKTGFLASTSTDTITTGQIVSAIEDSSASLAVDPTTLTNPMVFDANLFERDTWWLPSGNPDITSLAHAEDPRLLSFALQRTPASSLASSLDPGWIAPVPVVDQSTATLAHNAGAQALLVSHDTAEIETLRADAGDLPVATVPIGDDSIPVLIPSAGLTEAIESYRPGTVAQWSRVVAESALLALDGNPSALVAPGSRWQTSTSTPTLIEDFEELPWTTPTGLTDILGEAAPRSLSVPATAGEESDAPADYVAALGDELDPLATLATATTMPQDAYDAWGSVLTDAVRLSARLTPDAHTSLTNAALSDTATTLNSVSIASGSDLNLLSEDGEVPLTVNNELDWDVAVSVVLASNSPNLTVLDSPTVEVPAGETRQALVHVSAVSYANVDMTAHLESPDGVALTDDQQFSIRVRADWGTAATLVFTGLLVLLLIAGIIRTIRRGRKDTRTDAAPQTGDVEIENDSEEASERGADSSGTAEPDAESASREDTSADDGHKGQVSRD